MLVLEKILGSQNPADKLTKTIPIEKLKLCATSVGLLHEREKLLATANEELVMSDLSLSGRLLELWSPNHEKNNQDGSYEVAVDCSF